MGGLPSSLECLGSSLVSSDEYFIGLILYVLGEAIMCSLLFQVWIKQATGVVLEGKSSHELLAADLGYVDVLIAASALPEMRNLRLIVHRVQFTVHRQHS